jgi:hypothetical protein
MGCLAANTMWLERQCLFFLLVSKAVFGREERVKIWGVEAQDFGTVL